MMMVAKKKTCSLLLMIDRHTYIHKLYVCINWNWDVFHLCVYFCVLDLVTILAKRKKSLKKKFMLSNDSLFKKIVFIKQGQFTDTHTQLIWFLAFSCFKFSFCFVKFKKPKKAWLLFLLNVIQVGIFFNFFTSITKKKLRQEKKNWLTWYQWISSLSHTHTHTHTVMKEWENDKHPIDIFQDLQRKKNTKKTWEKTHSLCVCVCVSGIFRLYFTNSNLTLWSSSSSKNDRSFFFLILLLLLDANEMKWNRITNTYMVNTQKTNHIDSRYCQVIFGQKIFD